MRKKTLRILLVGAIFALGICLFIGKTIFARYSYEEVRVEIPAGVETDSVRTIMIDALGKNFGSKLYKAWRFQGGDAAKAHGSYLVSPGDDVIRLSRRIAEGRQTPIKLTFNNLRRIEDLASRVGNVLELDSAEFLLVMYDSLASCGISKANASAMVFPDSYEFYWTASPEKVIATLLSTRNDFWTPERRAKASKLGLSPEQVHTLASIVESETAKGDERGKVARLYINRLDKGMALQADPTVVFATGNFGLRRILGEHIKIDSPYNTYKHKGLPPGPIRIVERKTIDRVLDAPAHNYLYMCAKSDFSGYHDFAVTYDEHRINAARYHRELSRRNIQ